MIVSKALDISKIKYNLGSTTLYDLQNSESTFALAKSNLFIANILDFLFEKTKSEKFYRIGTGITFFYRLSRSKLKGYKRMKIKKE